MKEHEETVTKIADLVESKINRRIEDDASIANKRVKRVLDDAIRNIEIKTSSTKDNSWKTGYLDGLKYAVAELKYFEEMHWSERYRHIIWLGAIAFLFLLFVSLSRAEEPLPDSWAAQIELTDDQVFVPGKALSEFEAEFGETVRPREGEMEDGGDLDPTGKPVDMIIENIKGNTNE